jgi:hypothetical protein
MDSSRIIENYRKMPRFRAGQNSEEQNVKGDDIEVMALPFGEVDDRLAIDC